MKVAGLFAGIGGIEVGLHAAGFTTELLCEIDPGARAVLERRFAGIPLKSDIADIDSLPAVDVVAAGFPCQDLSQAGTTAGIAGRRSGLVSHVFRLIDDPGCKVPWLLLENVPFMLQLDRGRAMRYLTGELGSRGYRWAYRIVDTRAFGLPQRRRRVLLLASKQEDPREVLFGQDVRQRTWPDWSKVACGFYWTEGQRGLGWAVDAVPTLKGGSSIGIPSPPAIWYPESSRIVTPHIRDAERLQGFRAGWTEAAVASGGRAGARWKLAGNAVSVPVAKWLGQCFVEPQAFDRPQARLAPGSPWPIAAWGENNEAWSVGIGEWPKRQRYRHLREFLRHPTTPLSQRAAAGFRKRALQGNLFFVEGLLDDVAAIARTPTVTAESAHRSALTKETRNP